MPPVVASNNTETGMVTTAHPIPLFQFFCCYLRNFSAISIFEVHQLHYFDAGLFHKIVGYSRGGLYSKFCQIKI
jgi:hypothetical protein